MSHKEIFGDSTEEANKCAEKKKQALDDVEAMLKAFSENTRFQYALSKESCVRAIKHWTGVERLEGEEKAKLFDDVNEDYHEVLLPAMQAMKKMEAHCRAAERPFPIFEMLSGEPRLRDRVDQEAKIEEERVETIQSDMQKYKKHAWGLMIGMQVVMMGFAYYQVHYGTWNPEVMGGLSKNGTGLSGSRAPSQNIDNVEDSTWKAREAKLGVQSAADVGHELASDGAAEPNDELRRLRRLSTTESRIDHLSSAMVRVWRSLRTALLQ